VCSEIHKLIILFGIRNSCLRSGRCLLFYLFKINVINQFVLFIEASILSSILYILALLLPYPSGQKNGIQFKKINNGVLHCVCLGGANM